MAGTNFFVPISATCSVAFLDNTYSSTTGIQHAVFATCTGTPPTTAHVFQKGCLMIQSNVAAGLPAVYENTGTAAVPVWTLNSSAQTNGIVYGSVAKATSGTTAVNVFAATVPFPATITGILVGSVDTTAANITIADTAGTVATVAKGTVSGVVTAATSLTNTAVAKGDILTVVSSSAGNAGVIITFTSP